MLKRSHVYCLLLFLSSCPIMAGRYFNEKIAQKIYRENASKGKIRIPCFIRIGGGFDCVDPHDEILILHYDRAVKLNATHTKKVFIHICEEEFNNPENWTHYGKVRTEL